MIVQLGGQTALKLAEKLTKYGVKILGTSFESLDLAEDRGLFSNLLKENNIPYPEFDIATRLMKQQHCRCVGFSNFSSTVLCTRGSGNENCN